MFLRRNHTGFDVHDFNEFYFWLDQLFKQLVCLSNFFKQIHKLNIINSPPPA